MAPGLRSLAAPRNPSLEQLDTARATVARLEQLGEDEPFAPLADEAARAIVELERAATEALTDVPPPGAGPLARLALIEERISPAGYSHDLLALHQRSLARDRELALCLRWEPVVERVGAVAEARGGYPQGREAAAHGAREAAAYVQALAAQLVGEADCEPQATMLARDLPDLRRRLDAERSRREGAHREALAALEREEAEAEAAIRAAEQAQRRELAEWFSARRSIPFPIRGRAVSGAQVVAALTHSEARDVNGQVLEPASYPLEDLQRVKDGWEKYMEATTR